MAGCLIRSFLHTPDHISMFRFHKDSAAECLPDPIPMTCIKNKKYLINDNPVFLDCCSTLQTHAWVVPIK